MSKIAGRKKRGFTKGSGTKTSWESRFNLRSTCKKKLAQKNPTLLQKLKKLAAETEDEEEIVYDLTPQSNSDNSDKSRDNITKNSTFIPFLIYQTGYTSCTIVHCLAISPEKRIGTIKKLSVIGKKVI